MIEDTHGHERRISTIEANFDNLTDSLGEIKTYLGKLFSDTNDIKTGLALVVQNQEGMQEYQKHCDTDRKEYGARIDKVEGFQSRLIKGAIAVTGLCSLASPQLSKVWDKIFS